MMVVVFLVVVVVALFGAAVVATRDGDVLVDVAPDDAEVELPVGPVQPEDVAEVRFGMALRGYRMAEVDRVLARLAAELAARDSRIGELEQALVDVVEPELAKVEAQLSTAVVAEEPEQVHAPVVEAPAPAPEVVAEPVADLSAVDDDAFPEIALPDVAPDGAVEAVDQEPQASWSPSLEVPPDPVDLWTAPLETAEPAVEPEPVEATEPVVVDPSAADVPDDERPVVPLDVEEPPLGHPGEGVAVPSGDEHQPTSD